MKYEDIVAKTEPIKRSLSWFDRLSESDQYDLTVIRDKWRKDKARPKASEMGRAILAHLTDAGVEGLPKVRQVSEWLKGIRR